MPLALLDETCCNGRRWRYSKSHTSRSPWMSNASSFKSSSILFVEIGPTMSQPVLVVNSDSSHPIKAGRIYLDDKRGITTLRKYLFVLQSGYMFILLFPLSLTNPFNQHSSILSTRKFVRNLGSLRAFCLKPPSLPSDESDLHPRRVRTLITVITLPSPYPVNVEC